MISSKSWRKKGYFSYTIELVDGIFEKLEEIDALINELVANWEFSRIAKTDLAILRLGYLRNPLPDRCSPSGGD